MSNTPNLALPYIDAAQSQKHVTHNQALGGIDALAQLSVKQRGALAPPASPAAGDRYLLGAGAAGAFAGQDGNVAAFLDGAWIFAAPKTGWLCFVESEGALLFFAGGAWSDAGSAIHALQNLTLLGIGSIADANNPLSAKLNAALFTAQAPAEGGTGDLRFKLNKSAVANTVSQLYQDNYSGRAEVGLCGDDHFHVKVSADGAAWREALNVDPATGIVSFPSGVANSINTILNGAGAPPAATGVAGDFYIDTSNNRLYGPRGSAGWPAGYTALIGPAGAQGAAGAAGSQGQAGPSGPAGAAGANGAQGAAGSAGAAGANGNTILSVTAAPAAAQGANGDFAMDYTKGNLYGPKAAGAWPTTYLAIGGTVTQGSSGGALVFSYAAGDQRANIAVAASAGLTGGTVANLVAGAPTSNQGSAYFNAVALNGSHWVQFDFGAGKAIVNEISMWLSYTAGQGTWQVQASNDAATWVNLGATITLNQTGALPAATDIIATPAANVTAYRYYRLLGMSGSTNSGPWLNGFAFKIGH